MDGLIVKQPYADMIIDGTKTWELRNRSPPRNKLGADILLLSRCFALGVIRIVKDTGPLDADELGRTDALHRSGIDWPDCMSTTHAWEVEVVERFEAPKRYAHPNGAQIWVKGVAWPGEHPKDLDDYL